MKDKPEIGFAALNTIKPDIDDLDLDDSKARGIDAIADKHGFSSREPANKIVKRKMATEPTCNLTMRPQLSTFNRFVSFSIKHNLSYPEALKTLLDLASIDANGEP